MSAYCEIPRVLFFLDRTYSYPTLPWADLHGKEIEIEQMFLNSGGAVSGKFILRVIASAMHGRVDLLRAAPGGSTSWVMLTQEEAQLIVASLRRSDAQAHAS
jgi:hypothetical protein